METAVIITAYKRYVYVQDALNSVLRQTLLPNQIIIVADDIEAIKETLKIDKNISITLLEANYSRYGKQVSEAIKNLDKNVEIVFFLDDDDLFDKHKIEHISKIFDKYNDIVLVHNLQTYIDSRGREINDKKLFEAYEKNQPHKEVLISKQNFPLIYKEFPFIHHNHSSITIKRKLLEKYKDYIEQFDLMLDLPLFMISVMEGNILHIPERLTYYRIGSGKTSIANSSSYEDFLANERKIVCTMNRHLNDYRTLSFVIKEFEYKKIIMNRILDCEFWLYILNKYFECEYKAKLPPWNSILIRLIKQAIEGNISWTSLVKRIFAILLFLTIRNKATEIILNNFYSNKTL
ncbi:glycosyltransferase [Sulfurisphaera ohwakuensis]|uniref:Glycosyltransferase n=1 Tax=Sulfurisphaera ohwakuensis TaxID=69656 RepID=A0A650CIK3_SULOH|nr:glycosyltransferase [Sulfurisphaera ohwakuensis]MBB5255163.1 glycosyltransferase involved in cell wall biosynthesis [Sulfurisphaera ohwakuensis]QGR17642.1 glycosyltransferase [Sulfurisphaera ohwakuensis]